MDILVFAFALALLAAAIWVGGVLVNHWTVAGHPERFSRMTGILGYSVDGLRDTQLGLHVPTAERLCLACRNANACDAWLASDARRDEAPEFCPNAGFLQLARQPLVTYD